MIAVQNRAGKPDRFFFFIVILIALIGFFIFSSASLGLLGRENAKLNLIAFKQFFVLIAGLVLFLVVSRVPYRFWQRASGLIFLAGVILSILIFVPSLGLESGGARRWLLVGDFTFQPSELLKFGFVLYLAAWLSRGRQRIEQAKNGLWPFLILSMIVGILMVLEPDIDTLVIMLGAGLAMFYAAGARFRHLGLIALVALAALASVALYKPYIISRVQTFLNPDENVLGASYQINQSLIAIGSGGLFGRGFGQSIQKFKYLPEPIGDSIFSVAGEEFGFVGGVVIISTFLLFALAGLRIAARAPTAFGRLATVGIVIMIMTGTFINMASMLGLIPLTGTPLIFVSHGGTALLFALVEAGIILNISRHAARSR